MEEIKIDKSLKHRIEGELANIEEILQTPWKDEDLNYHKKNINQKIYNIRELMK